ncbi:unnamed protein product [Allacma fusca]|uniref:CRAL-TRIO domain-containing protein n=1 Tax=Allacma fusca TaxID=39272 RepID=A0A8J2JQL9_9HEXA|nr:unnamed protein product [Allacma fusca]
MTVIIIVHQCTLILYISITFSLLVNCQIPKEEIPAELQHLFDSDLSSWKPPADIRTNYPYYLSGFDEDNRPIWILEFGKWDIRSALEKGEDVAANLDKHIDTAIWNFLDSTKTRSTSEDPVTEFVVIIDANGYSFHQLNSLQAVSFVIKKLKLITIATRFASEVYAVNVNFVAEKLLTILKPVLGQEFEKFMIFGTNANQWIPRMLKKIPRSQLPEWYGGKANFKPVMVFG